MSDLPTKKQKELLSFIDGFIKGNGYGPSYRETMRALGYKSVSTVASHIDNLIAKGYLVKRTYSARSLEVTTPNQLKTEQQELVWLRAQEKSFRDRGDTEDADVLAKAIELLDQKGAK